MWESLPLEIRGRLRPEYNRLIPEREHTDWERNVEAIEQYRELADDYDGQGAIAPSANVIESAMVLVREFIEADLAVPTYCVAGVNGSVNLVWDFVDESSVSLEVIDPSHVEVILVEPSQNRSWTLNRIVEEVVG